MPELRFPGTALLLAMPRMQRLGNLCAAPRRAGRAELIPVGRARPKRRPPGFARQPS
ncbi:protein of unknown function [Burkholderia multivorans]